MAVTPKIDEAAIFNEARHIAELQARSQYLRAACSGNEPLCARLEALLRVHVEEPTFLEATALPRPAAAVREGPGTLIGPYRLLEQIGEGGFGVVFRAEQQPLHRAVAVKILKPGLDTSQVVARFEAERQALALMIKLGPYHADTLSSMHNVASGHEALGRHGFALELRLKTLALWKEKFGPYYAGTLAAMGTLANSYYVHGRMPEALQLYKETLELRKTHLGPNHPDTLASMSNLGNALATQNKTKEALALRLETLAAHQANLGPHHPGTLGAMANLASSYFLVGQRDKALKLREETLALQRTYVGLDHPATLASMNNLAVSYAAADRPLDELELRRETLALRKAKLGPGHPDTLVSMGTLVMSYASLGRRAEAVPIIDECVRLAAGKVVPAGMIPSLMDVRLRHFEKNKDGAGCRATAELWEKLKQTDPASLYIAARYRAVTARVLREADTVPDASKQAEAEADKAMVWLRQAVAAGYANRKHIKQVNDLDALRDRADFHRLVADLEASQAKK